MIQSVTFAIQKTDVLNVEYFMEKPDSVILDIDASIAVSTPR